MQQKNDKLYIKYIRSRSIYKNLKFNWQTRVAFVTFDINNEKIDAGFFVDAYKEYEAVLSATKLVLVNAVVRERNDSLQLQINKMKSLQ